MSKIMPAAALLLVLAAPASAFAGKLPDGRYDCRILIGSARSSVGIVEVKGNSYRGPSHSPGGAWKPLSIDAAGVLRWQPNFSQISATGATITGSRVSKPVGGRPSFAVDYTTRSGWKESMDCTRV